MRNAYSIEQIEKWNYYENPKNRQKRINFIYNDKYMNK